MPSNHWQAFAAESRRQTPGPVLCVGLDSFSQHAELGGFHVLRAETSREALDMLEKRKVSVLVVGSQLPLAETLNLLDSAVSLSKSRDSSSPLQAVVLRRNQETELLQRFVDEGTIFYLSRGEIDAESLRAIVSCAADHFLAKENAGRYVFDETSVAADRLLDFCARLPMQSDLSSAATLLTRTLHEVIQVSYGQCLVYDAAEDTLTSSDAVDGEQFTYSAASGLSAFVARTGEKIHLQRIGGDPRYDSDVDNPAGADDAQLVALPIVGTRGVPIAVVMAVRSGKDAPFSSAELQLLDLIAECATPTFRQIVLQREVQTLLTRRSAGAENNAGVFREEALDYHIRSWDRQGNVLRTLPGWLRRAYWLVMVLTLGVFVVLALLMPQLKSLFGKVN